MPAEIKFCHCCRQGQLQIISDFSKQARCIDFRHSLTESPESIIKFDFAIAQCDTCGLIQLLQPIDYQSMLTEFDWINNKEPVQHHTWMAKDILQILGNDENVLFLSKYDQKIFDLVSQKIGKRAFILDSTKDLLIDSDNPQQAQIQNKITPEIFSVLCSRYGHFDLIVSCRLLEHAHNSYGFMNALRFLLKPQGRIIIEVPESTKALLQGDISMLWEEHISYFTTESLKSSFLHLGLQFERSWLYPYPQEDAIAALFSDIKQEVRSIFPAVSGEQNLALNYLHKISVLKQKIQFELMHFQKQYGDIVIFGA
ncbi:MAG: class I SAM-dependent methyltransferase, partial [gamma proteobacterium symbiont of Taylorina sp.]|nr:class I SAM-dependent methyltransferase [gamma proteobacterium symbiont of Taylorina sp.]